MQTKRVGMFARASVVVVLVGALAASASAPKRHTIDKSMATVAPFDPTWAAVIEVFADQNWVIQNMEKDSGLITTDWMSLDESNAFADCGGSGMSRVLGRELRFNVLVRAGADGSSSSVSVNATFRESRSWDGRQWYVDCNSTGRVEHLIHDLVAESLSRRPVRAPTIAQPPPAPPSPVSTTPSPTTTAPADGTLGGACYGNQTCNAGLRCDDLLGQCTPAE
jgi:hypothetical protein